MLDDDDVERPAEADGVDAPEEVEERTYPSTIGGALYLVMLGVITIGLLVVALGPWRTGIRIFAGALVVGAGLRVALKERDAGMLAVRSKPIDVSLYLAVAAALVVLSTVIPDQPV